MVGLRLMTTLEKSSLTGPEIFVVVFLHVKGRRFSEKNNLVIIEKIPRFIRGLIEENKNSQISQNRARLCTFKIALNTCESLYDLN